MNRYSLANYIVSINPTDASIRSMFGTMAFGGEGSAIGSISVGIKDNLWSTKSYATGAWVHNKNLSRVGTVKISINQLAPPVQRFIKLCKLYYGADYNGFTITVADIAGNKVATCTDCFIEAIPSQDYNEEASDQSWSFTCGKIDFA